MSVLILCEKQNPFIRGSSSGPRERSYPPFYVREIFNLKVQQRKSQLYLMQYHKEHSQNDMSEDMR